MRKKSSIFCFVVIILALFLGCAKAKFTDSTGAYTNEAYLTFSDAYYTKDGSNYEVKKPVSILFLLDITQSMTPYIETVKSNLTTLVNKLEKKNYHVKIGYLSFKDDVKKVSSISDDTQAFKQSVSNIEVSGGYDFPEAGLLAIQKASSIFQDTSLKSYLKTMVLISDDLSHSHPDTVLDTQELQCNPKRNCSIKDTYTLLNELPSELQTSMKLFYSVPSQSECSCSGYSSPKKQLEELLSRSFISLSSDEDKGAYLGWPFSDNSILSTLPKMIEKLTDPKILCLSKGITVKIDGQTLSYKSSFQEEYNNYLASKNSSMKLEDESLIKALKNHSTGTVSVDLSCFDMVDAEEGNFSSPITKDKKDIEYKLEIKHKKK